MPSDYNHDSNFSYICFLYIFPCLVDRSLKRRQVKPLAASLLDALDYDSSDDSDFEVGDASGKNRLLFLAASDILMEH